MKDMNIAKLTSQDLLLFNGIMSDLFPGVDTPINDYGKVCTVFFNKCLASYENSRYVLRTRPQPKVSKTVYFSLSILGMYPANKVPDIR